MVEIKIDLSKCDGCGTCAANCPVGVYEIVDGKSKAVDINACIGCLTCEAQCPHSAIQVID